MFYFILFYFVFILFYFNINYLIIITFLTVIGPLNFKNKTTMFNQIYVPECFNLDDFNPQETTFENVELSEKDSNLISSLEEE